VTGSDPGIQRLRGIHPVLEALRAGRRALHQVRVREGARPRPIAELVELAGQLGVPVEEVEAGKWHEEPPGQIELLAGALPEVSLEDLARAGEAPRTLVALDGVEDPQNLGAIARVAEAAGASGLLLTRRRSAPLSASVSRASAGAIEWLPVARVTNLVRALKQLKTMGFWVFGSTPEGGDDLFSLPDRIVRGDRIVVLGGEGPGLRPGTLRAVDHRVVIPMAGRVASLNVGAAAAVTLFELTRRGRLASSP